MPDTDREYSLEGHVALVTGSGRGLGHAIAIRLAELGASVAVHDEHERAPAEFGEFADLASSHAQVAAVGRRTCIVTGDIADQARVQAMVGEVEQALGPITLLVNAAGGDIAKGGGKPAPNNALEIKMEDVRALLDRNLIGTMLLCRAVVPGMRNQIEGGALQGLSRALGEEVTWDEHRVTSVDWRSYRSLPLGFNLPAIESVLINRTDAEATGAGETAITVVAAAVGNAIFDATGARIREVPFTAERVKAAISGIQRPS